MCVVQDAKMFGMEVALREADAALDHNLGILEDTQLQLASTSRALSLSETELWHLKVRYEDTHRAANLYQEMYEDAMLDVKRLAMILHINAALPPGEYVKVDRIKYYRSLSGEGLRECKAWVEDNFWDNGKGQPRDVSPDIPIT